MENMSNLQKWLLRLSAPYKESDAYELFGNVKKNPRQGSCFWRTQIGYVVKYENAKLENSNIDNN